MIRWEKSKFGMFIQWEFMQYLSAIMKGNKFLLLNIGPLPEGAVHP
jgi:hypothetical protein